VLDERLAAPLPGVETVQVAYDAYADALRGMGLDPALTR
jgi:hypothetical protein